MSTDTRFWRALKGERRVAERRRDAAVTSEPPSPDASTVVSPPPRAGEDRRRQALLAMLRASEARQARIARKRRPVLATGTRARIVGGELSGLSGIVLDADYIESRVLLRIDGRERACWIPFSHVGPD